MAPKIIKYILIPGLIFLASLVFLPRKYEVLPFPQRANTQYWNLPSGSTIGYFEIAAIGPKHPYPIIYLHGGPGGRVTEETILPLTALAKEGYEVYCYDQIGSGHSERLENIKEYTVDRHLQDLEAIVDKITSSKVILIGHSWGAILATLFVADHQDKVEKMILTGPGSLLPIRRELAALPSPDSLQLKAPLHSNSEGNDKVYNWRSKVMLRWAYIFGSKLAKDKEADDFAAYLFKEVNKAAVKDTNHLPMAKGGAGFYAHIMTSKSFAEVHDRRSQLQGTTLPVLILKGQYDNQKWGFTQEYLSLFPNHQLTIIPDAGHFIELEQVDRYLQAIKTFLN